MSFYTKYLAIKVEEKEKNVQIRLHPLNNLITIYRAISRTCRAFPLDTKF